MQVAPSATYEASIDWGATGATIGMRVVDNAGATTVARVTGFTEYPAGSGVYYRGSNTAPATAGQYTLVYDDDAGTAAIGHVATEDLLVTTEATSATISSGNLYVTRAALKATLNIASTYADTDIDVAVNAASRAIDGYKDDRFYPTTETRYYSPYPRDRRLDIDSLNALTSVTVDTDGDGVYETTWTNATDFILTPANAATDGFPYRRLELLDQAGRTFPGYHQKGVKVIGSFGWAACPSVVAQAAGILAGRFLKRARETPYGILVVTGDAVAAARLGKIDPDVAFLLDNLHGSVPLLAI